MWIRFWFIRKIASLDWKSGCVANTCCFGEHKLLNFTAIDFETANSHRGSPCQVGLVKIRSGEVVDEQSWLIKPPETVGHFDSFNVALHGIDANVVKDSSPWRSVVVDIAEFIEDDLLIAHNASFDIGVIRDACTLDQIRHPELSFICTMVISRKVLNLPSYGLPHVAEELEVPMGVHHDALDDARGAASIALGLASKYESTSLDELVEAVDVSVGSLMSGQYSGSISKRSRMSSRLIAPETDLEADPSGFFYGQVVVFTGTLKAMRRQKAWERVAGRGGIPEERPTRRTNVLVIGGLSPHELVPGARLTSKAQKALALQRQGQHIEVMTEAEFLEHLSSV